MGRTSKNIKLRIPEKPRKIKGFRSGNYRVATTISSQPRYDHFDTSPYSNSISIHKKERFVNQNFQWVLLLKDSAVIFQKFPFSPLSFSPFFVIFIQ